MGTETWLGTSLATVVVWGIGTLVSKPATTRLGIRRMLAFVAVGEGGVYALLFLISPVQAPSSDTFPWIAAFLAGITGTLGYVFYYSGILEGSVGLMGTVTAAYPVPTILLSLWLLGESLSLPEAAGIVLVLLCVLVLGGSSKPRRTGKTSALVFALLAFVVWGIWGYFAKVAVDGVGERIQFGFYSLSSVLVLGPFLVFTRNRPFEAPHRSRGRGALYGVLDTAFGASGVVLLTLAFSQGPASLVAAVTGAYPLVSTFLAHVFLKEKFGWKEATALALFVPGIFLIAV